MCPFPCFARAACLRYTQVIVGFVRYVCARTRSQVTRHFASFGCFLKRPSFYSALGGYIPHLSAPLLRTATQQGQGTDIGRVCVTAPALLETAGAVNDCVASYTLRVNFGTHRLDGPDVLEEAMCLKRFINPETHSQAQQINKYVFVLRPLICYRYLSRFPFGTLRT